MMKLSRLVLSMSLAQPLRWSIGQLMIMSLAQPLLWNIGGATSASASPQQPKPKSFAGWCQQKESVPADTRQTIDVLLKKAGTKDCQKADTKLRNLTSLNLDNNQIIDVKPLAGLTNLTDLWLERNQIPVKTCPVKPEAICKF
jgi:internalin A